MTRKWFFLGIMHSTKCNLVFQYSANTSGPHSGLNSSEKELHPSCSLSPMWLLSPGELRSQKKCGAFLHTKHFFSHVLIQGSVPLEGKKAIAFLQVSETMYAAWQGGFQVGNISALECPRHGKSIWVWREEGKESSHGKHKMNETCAMDLTLIQFCFPVT